MDVKARYTVNISPEKFNKRIKPQLMAKVEALVVARVNAYIADLESHMGTIHGGVNHNEGRIHWDALDEETLEDSPKFWFQSGKAKNAIVVNLAVSGNKISAFVGVMSNSSAYKEVLWNEFGFTPEDGDKLIRRPLFIPLADFHKKELQEQINQTLRSQPITVEL